MARRIKLIWDFRGPNAGPIASHHCVHLIEFASEEPIENAIIEVEKINDNHHIAFMVVDEKLVDELRSRLKPHRGQHYNP
jgi:hypothetical protein